MRADADGGLTLFSSVKPACFREEARHVAAVILSFSRREKDYRLSSIRVFCVFSPLHTYDCEMKVYRGAVDSTYRSVWSEPHTGSLI